MSATRDGDGPRKGDRVRWTRLRPYVVEGVLEEVRLDAYCIRDDEGREDPRVFFENDDTGEAYDPATQTVGWNLSFGCHLTVGMQDGHLQVQVSTSDVDQREGVTQRTVTANQLRDYAAKLIDLAHKWDVRQTAASAGCDLTALCEAEQHAITCLGLYRTADEVRMGVIPPESELDRRRDNERFHRAYVRAGGGS